MAAQRNASKHVLVLNDSEEVLALFRQILEDMGHRVSLTTIAPNDLEEVVKASPDLLILDLVLGRERQGWGLLQKMRMTRETEHIPVVVCTAATDDVREQEGWLTSQAIKVVLKPFSVDQLEQAVNSALELPDVMVGSDGDSDSRLSSSGGAKPN